MSTEAEAEAEKEYKKLQKELADADVVIQNEISTQLKAQVLKAFLTDPRRSLDLVWRTPRNEREYDVHYYSWMEKVAHEICKENPRLKYEEHRLLKNSYSSYDHVKIFIHKP